MDDLMRVLKKNCSMLIICLCYLLFYIIRWAIFEILGKYDILWWKSWFYCIPVVTVSYSILCSVLGQKILGFFTYIGRF